MSEDKRAAAKIGFVEFVVLAAAMMSTQAIAIDAMLPAFPTIVQALHIANENHVQWIVTAYMAGLGCGQLFWGLMSDRFGRRPILVGGLGLYVLSALLSGHAGSFHALLAWRFVHGLSAASVVVTRSVIRDLYSGRHMARVMSLTIMVFLMVPILAPSLGALILMVAAWRYIFIVCGIFAAFVCTWALLRLPETLHPEYRLTLTYAHIRGAVRLVLFNRCSLFYTLAMTVMFGGIMAYVGMVQQTFGEVFHRANLMPAIFALCATTMGVAAFLNSRIVERLGMRRISHTALLVYLAVSGRDHGVFLAVDFQFRSHGHGPGRVGCRHRRVLAGFHVVAGRRARRRPDRPAVQRHHGAARGRIDVLRTGESPVRTSGGEGQAVQRPSHGRRDAGGAGGRRGAALRITRGCDVRSRTRATGH